MSDAAIADPHDVRPIVPTGSASNLGLWAFLVVLALGGWMLYSILSAAEEEPGTSALLTPSGAPGQRIASPAPLTVPARLLEREVETAPMEEVRPAPEPIPPRPIALPTYQPITPIPVVQPPDPIELPPPPPAPPQVVFEARSGPVQPTTGVAGDADRQRVTASRFQNPSHTIPQGTVIPAVLETALDSTRAGGARALVQRDIWSWDGTKLLIPRGSRLYGEYEAGLQRGQNRALVQWTRLMRPDGVTIALDSPSSDPLGRAGVRGKVDSKFFQRFGNAILQSVLDIGVGLAVNEASDGVIVALPGSTQNVQVTDPQAVVPTLKIKHGTSVSVFVARDLDFSTVD